MLTDASLRALKPKHRPYKKADAEGLFILITPSGSKLWRFAYRYHGKQKTLPLGRYPEISLLEARKARMRVREMVAHGLDPAHEKKDEKRRAKIAAGNTFRIVAEEWFELQKLRQRPSYHSRVWSRLDDDLFPSIGMRPINAIQPLEVLDAIRKIEARGAIETAKRVMNYASGIFRYGISTGRCASDPTRDLRGALLPPKPVKSRKWLRADQLPSFLTALRAYEGKGMAATAIELTMLSLLRTDEIRFARWEEFDDLDGPEPIWRIPGSRMKEERPHLVPLAPRAVALLKIAKEASGNSPWVFPAKTKTGVISENTMLFALYRMGYKGMATIHGMRKTASTILNEHQYNRDWVEMQLAHADGSVRRIYNQAEWLPGRRQMMCWYAEYIARAAGDTQKPKAAAA